MTLPTIIFGLVVAILYGALYHLVRGGSGWRLLLFLGLSILGFGVGLAIAAWQGWSLYLVGSLELGLGSLGSLIFLTVGEWLSQIETGNESSV